MLLLPADHLHSPWSASLELAQIMKGLQRFFYEEFEAARRDIKWARHIRRRPRREHRELIGNIALVEMPQPSNRMVATFVGAASGIVIPHLPCR